MNRSVSSEFEKERQRILAEIEARATREGGQLTLQEWLKAAEEVMPDEQSRHQTGAGEDPGAVVTLSERARQSRPSAEQPVSDPLMEERNTMAADTASPSRKTLFFGYFIGSVVALLMLAAGALAYVHLSRQIQSIAENTTALKTLVEQTQQRLDKIESSGSVAVDEQLNELARRLSELESQSLSDRKDSGAGGSDRLTDQVRAELNDANVVTEAVLDAKLDQFSQRIEQAIDKRFATILAQLKHLNSRQSAEPVAPPAAVAVQRQTEVDEKPSVAEPKAPQAPAEPVVAPVDHDDAESGFTADEQWLASQPAASWTLQLASVLDRSSLERLRKNKGLSEARIVRQRRAGQVFFVLIEGSFADRVAAHEAASAIRARTGISPWVRPVGDLQRRLPTP